MVQDIPDTCPHRVLILAQDLHLRAIDATTGEILRELTIDPTRDNQPREPE